MLQIPVTIRVPSPDEMSHRPDIEQLLEKRKKAQIKPGYQIIPNNNPKLAWQFQAAINVDQPQLWLLVAALVDLMPDEVYAEYSCNEEEVYSTTYYPKKDLLTLLLPFKQELLLDASLQFAIVSNQPGNLNETTVTSFKYVRFTGNNMRQFQLCMKTLHLDEVPEIAFIDEYPTIIEPLKKFIPTSRRPEEVVRSLNKTFGIGM